MDTATTGKIDKQSNLRRGNPAWVKGMPSPHPVGATPKERCVSRLLAELIKGDAEKVKQKWLKETKNHPTGGMIIAMAFFAKMGRGDLTAIKEGLDRVEGKVKDIHDIDLTTKGEAINGRRDIPESDIAEAIGILERVHANTLAGN